MAEMEEEDAPLISQEKKENIGFRQLAKEDFKSNVDFLCCGGYKRELRQLRAERKAFEEASAPAPPALRVSTHDLLLLLMCLRSHSALPLRRGAPPATICSQRAT